MRVKSQESRVKSQKLGFGLQLPILALDSRLSTLDSATLDSRLPRSAPHADRAAGRDHHSHDDRGGGDSDHGAVERRPPAARGHAQAQHVHHRCPGAGDGPRPAVWHPAQAAVVRHRPDIARQRRQRQRGLPRGVLRRAAAAVFRIRSELAVRISRHPESETGFAVQFVRRGFAIAVQLGWSARRPRQGPSARHYPPGRRHRGCRFAI